MSEQLRSYGTVRGIFSFLEFVGWSVVAIGIIVGFTLSGTAGRYASGGETFMLFLLGASSSLVGLFFVGCVQHWRAGVDSAEYGQQMLKIARDQLTVSKQGLKAQNAETRSYSSQISDEHAPEKGSKRRALKAASHSASQEPNEHRGQKIFRVGGSHRAVGDIFRSHKEAVAAIDRKLDTPAVEEKPEATMSILLGPDPVSVSADAKSVLDENPNERSNGGATPPPRSDAGTAETLNDGETRRAAAQENPGIETLSSDEEMKPEPADEQQDVARKIKEEDGKFVYGRMEFSSREAAEKYIRQLGVNPNFRN